MDRLDFAPQYPGRLTSVAGGSVAFVPDPLPPEIKWDATLATAVAEAQGALGRLAEVGRMMPNPHLLIRPFMRREAVLSSQIEGTQASHEDLLLFELDERVEQRTPDVREVSNYVKALEHGLERVSSLPLSLRLIREMHRILMEQVRGGDQNPGEFRRKQVHIGSEGQSIADARFVPPPPGDELTRVLSDFESYLHTPDDLGPVVRLALVHYQFEAIHPFADGNGRIGRLLISLILCLENILPQPLLYLSAYFERHRQDYYEHLLQVSRKGAWEKWITFVARGVAEQAIDAVERATRLRELQAQYVEKVRSARTSALLLQLIDHLFDQPYVKASNVRDILQVTPRTAQQHIDRLREAGILREITGQDRNRVYCAQGIIDAVREPLSPF